MKNQYIFIDGACLRNTKDRVAKDYFNGQTIYLDYANLFKDFEKVFIYDALPHKNENETEEAYQARIIPEVKFLNYLRNLKGFHVYEGITRKRKKRKRVEQKKVDVMLTVDVLHYAFKKNHQKVTLLTSDLDFLPLIEILVQEGIFIEVWYPPKKTNKELIYAADAKRAFNVYMINSNLLPLSKESCSQSIAEKVTINSSEVPPEWQYIEEKKTKIKFDEIPVTYYKADKEYVAVIKSEFRNDLYTSITLSDKKLLEKYVNEHLLEVTPY